MTPLFRTCLGCGHRWDPENEVSPGEGDGCVECWATEEPEGVA